MLNVWIGNLGKYNEGELVGEWLSLPVTDKELENFLREKVGLQLTQKEVDESLAKNGICYEEYMINDYETDLPIKVSEYSNLNMLNLLAKASERVTNMEAVEAYIECENTDDIEEIINIMLQEDRIPYYTYGIENDTLSKEAKYGMQKAEMMGLTELLQKHNIENYFDYEAYGNEDDLSGYVELFDEGYIDRSETNAVDLHLYSSEEIKEELSDEEIVENQKLKIIYKEIGKDPVVMEIDDTLEAKQKLVGGLIEVVPYKDNLLLICNEEGKITNLKPNLQFDYDYIAGNCFIVGDDYENSDFKSIEDSQSEEIKKDLQDRTIILEEIQEVEETEEMEF